MNTDQNDQAKYETGARKLEERPGVGLPDVLHTGDPSDRPKKPYGLTEPVDDRGEGSRHYDGTDQPKHGAG